GRDHDPAPGGEGRQERPGGCRRDPEDLLPAVKSLEQRSVFVLAEIRTRQVEIRVTFSVVGMTQKEDPEAPFRSQLAPDPSHLLRDRFTCRGPSSQLPIASRAEEDPNGVGGELQRTC